MYLFLIQIAIIYCLIINYIMSIILETIETSKKDELIFNMYDNKKLIKKGTCTLLGSYNYKKNIWLWSSYSPTLHKQFVRDCEKYKNLILKQLELTDNNQHKKYIDIFKDDFSIISKDVFKTINNIISDITQKKIITIQNEKNPNIHILCLVENILIN